MTDYNLQWQKETGEQVEKDYTARKKKHRGDMLRPGEEGAAAARELEKLEAAYQTYKEAAAREAWTAQTNAPASEAAFAFIEELIKQGKIIEAQDALDRMTQRPAEWYFVQALIYYKKSWFLECRKQLEISVKMEPGNKKYKDNYLSLLAYSEILEQQKLAEDAVAAAGRPPDVAAARGDCCAGNNGSCTAPCIADCCFRDEEK